VISQLVDTPDFAGQPAALIGIGVGIDYALIYVTRYRAEHARGLDREEALLLAMDTAGRTARPEAPAGRVRGEVRDG